VQTGIGPVPVRPVKLRDRGAGQDCQCRLKSPQKWRPKNPHFDETAIRMEP
jgi:hypothetical protein